MLKYETNKDWKCAKRTKCISSWSDKKACKFSNLSTLHGPSNKCWTCGPLSLLIKKLVCNIRNHDSWVIVQEEHGKKEQNFLEDKKDCLPNEPSLCQLTADSYKIMNLSITSVVSSRWRLENHILQNRGVNEPSIVLVSLFSQGAVP